MTNRIEQIKKTQSTALDLAKGKTFTRLEIEKCDKTLLVNELTGIYQ